MAPHGAAQPLLGTDPVGLALPRGEGKAPLALDMALSTAARSFALRAIQRRSLSSSPHGSFPGRWPVNAQEQGLPRMDIASSLFAIIEHSFVFVKHFPS